MILPVFDNNQIANYLTDSYWSAAGSARHVFPGSTISYNVQGLTDAGRSLAVAALQAWSAVSGLQFVPSTGSAQIMFDDNQPGGATSYTSSNGVTTQARVNVGLDFLSNYGTGINSYSFQAYIHEIGHALGLGHGGNYNGSATYRTDGNQVGSNHYLNDSWQASVMSYFSQSTNSYINASYAYVVGPMMADIIAIQNLYGVATNKNVGNTTYGFNSTASGYFNLNQFNEGSMVAFTIFDSAGTDTLDASGFIGSQLIDLRSGSYSNIGGEIGNIGIAVNTVIEYARGGRGHDEIRGNAIGNVLIGNEGNDVLFGFEGDDSMRGGAGNDSIYGHQGRDELVGDDGDDFLVGGAGADRIDGWNGIDTVAYDGATSGLTVDLRNLAANTGDAAGDTYFNIERIAGSYNFRDVLVGNAAANVFFGRSGNDHLVGQGGDDTLLGEDGDDFLIGGAGADVMNGGAGIDNAAYDGAQSAVIVDLQNLSANAGDASGDTYLGIEAIAGTWPYGDRLLGNGDANTFFGHGGDDLLDGRGGDDTLLGDENNDRLIGGNGSDRLTGGTGSDIFVFSATSESQPGAYKDIVLDFSRLENDVIDLSAIDASSIATGNQAFAFIGASAFTGVTGQLRYFQTSPGRVVEGDVTGDGQADFQIMIVANVNPLLSDFIL